MVNTAGVHRSTGFLTFYTVTDFVSFFLTMLIKIYKGQHSSTSLNPNDLKFVSKFLSPSMLRSNKKYRKQMTDSYWSIGTGEDILMLL